MDDAVSQPDFTWAQIVLSTQEEEEEKKKQKEDERKTTNLCTGLCQLKFYITGGKFTALMEALIPGAAPAFQLSFLKFSSLFVLPAEIFAHRVCLLAVSGYPGIYKHRFFALWLNASMLVAGRIRQLTGFSDLNWETRKDPDPISQSESLGYCETPGRN